MRILFICNYKPGVGGISGQVETLQRHLHEDNHIADLFSTKGSVLKRLCLPFCLNRSIKQYDIIHIHCCSGWGFLPAILGILAGKKGGKRTILTYHGGGAETFFAKHKRLVTFFLMRTDTNIVLSGFLGTVFDKYQIPYTIIPNIIELDATHYRERNNLNPDYICIRSHEDIYNIPCILRAFKRVQERIPESTLTLVGDGSQHNALKSLAHEMGIHNISFTGRVANNDIYKHLDKADIMLSSPTVDNMPVSLLEAMNAGLLVISSNVGGVPYILKDRINGYLFESNDDKALSSIMLESVLNQEQSKRITAAAHQSIMSYCWDSIKDRILAIYKRGE